MWEDYWTPYADDSGWWDGGGGVDSWWDAPEYATADFGAGGDWFEPGWDGGAGPQFPSLEAPAFSSSQWNLPSIATRAGVHDLASSAPPLVSSAPPSAALTASMPLHAYDDWGQGSNYRSDYTLDTVDPSRYGSQLPTGTSWEQRLGAMADRIVGQLPKMALSALVGKPKLPGGGAMDTLNASVARSNAFNDRLMSDYTTNMPGIQQTGLRTLAQTTPQAQANEAYRGAMVSDAAGRRALERRMSASSMSPEARMAAMSRYDIGAGANRAQAYNAGLGRGLGQTMSAATQAASLFPQPNYGATGSLAAAAAGMAANRGMQEFNMRQLQLSDISGLLDGYEEGRERGMRRQSYL